MVQEHKDLEVILRNSISFPKPYEDTLFEPVAGHDGSKATKQAKLTKTNNADEDSEDESIGD